MIAHHGEAKAEAWLTGVKANLARKPKGGDRDQVKAVAEGECDIALGNSYYYGAMLKIPEQKPWAEAVNLVFPTIAGTKGTPVTVSGLALTKPAPHRANALQLMEFRSGEPAQEI